MSNNLLQMKAGHIYHIDYGGTSLVARFNEENVTQYELFSALHYWNGHEDYQANTYCVKSGIVSIREATVSEKHNLFNHEVKHNTL